MLKSQLLSLIICLCWKPKPGWNCRENRKEWKCRLPRDYFIVELCPFAYISSDYFWAPWPLFCLLLCLIPGMPLSLGGCGLSFQKGALQLWALSGSMWAGRHHGMLLTWFLASLFCLFSGHRGCYPGPNEWFRTCSQSQAMASAIYSWKKKKKIAKNFQ